MNLLQKFARDMLAALDADVKPKWFKPHVGLCTNLSWWCEYHGHDALKASDDLTARFVAKDLDRAYPFNSTTSYMSEKNTDAMYKNPERMVFLKELAEGLINTETVRYIPQHVTKSANQG